MGTYLIVADRKAWSAGLARRLSTVGRDRSAEFVVVVPADPSLYADEVEAVGLAREAAARACTSLRLQGLTVLDALAGPATPRRALEEELGRGARSYDGIFVGLLARSPTVQIHPDLVRQLERKHGIPVRLITCSG
jgi:hypothetical protein